MYLFFVEKENIGAQIARITGPDVNHIKNVLRMRPGSRLRISDGERVCYSCEITELSDEAVDLKLLERDEDGTELPARIVLYQCLPKGDKMEWIIQKNTELGVSRIVPVASRRAVVRLDEKKAAAKVRRWSMIAESAAKQSKRTVIPVVAPVMGFREAVDEAADSDCKLFPYENTDGMAATRAALSAVKPGMSIAVFIGPEGGFEEEEAEYAREKGFMLVSLGRRILRTETAGMCLLSELMLRLER